MTTVVRAFAPDLFFGKTVLVSGGTSGIGLGTAIAFRELGAAVVATGAMEHECERARGDPVNGGIRFATLDVRDREAVNATLAALERVDVVVNAAGVIRRDAE